MASIPLRTIAAIRRFGAESPGNKKLLQDWKLAALLAINSGESGQAVAVSANGVSASWSQGATNIEWFTALDEALQYLQAGLTPSSKTFGRIV